MIKKVKIKDTYKRNSGYSVEYEKFKGNIQSFFLGFAQKIRFRNKYENHVLTIYI